MDEITAVFRIIGPNITSDTFTVGQIGLRAGRSADNELVLASSEISRHHLRLEWIGGEICVRDLNSSNGVWFNDERIRTDTPQPLKPGESFRAGPFLVTLDHIDTPKKKKAPAATMLDAPVAPPPAPAPEPEPEPAPAPEPEPYIAQTAPPVEPPPVIEEPVAVQPPEPEAPAASAEPPVAEPPPEPPVDEAPRKRHPKAEQPAPAPAADDDSRSFLFTPVKPEEVKPAEPEPPVAVEKPVKEKKPAPPPEPPKSDDPFDKMPRIGGDGASLSPEEPLPPLPSSNGHAYPVGIPRDASTWLKYLPAIYQDDPFIGRYLLIFEAMMSPDIWAIDNLELYYSPEMAPLEWVRWVSGWFDIFVSPELPASRQRAIMSQLGWLAARRGTRAGLERLLELYCGVRPEIIEEPAHFTVRIPLSETGVALSRELIDDLIRANKPAFASYTLEIS